MDRGRVSRRRIRSRCGSVAVLLAGLLVPVLVSPSTSLAEEPKTITVGELLRPLPGFDDQDLGPTGIDAISAVVAGELAGRQVVGARDYTPKGASEKGTAYVIGHADTTVSFPVVAGSYFCAPKLSVRGMGVCEFNNDVNLWVLEWGANPAWLLRTFSYDKGVAERLMAALVLANTAGRGGGAPGETLPALGLPRLTGKGSLQLRSLVGQVVVLNFWSSKCAQCSQEDGVLARAAGAYGDAAGVRVVRVVYQDKPAAARPALTKLQPDYDVVTDPGSKAAKAVGVNKAPSTIVVNRQGRVAVELRDPVDDKTLSTALDSVLYGTPS